MSAVGFIGLGAMGGAIARNLLEAGLELTVWNRSSGPMEELVAMGAVASASPVEALLKPVSISMLADDEAVDSVLTSQVLREAAGAIHVCMASISPEASDRLGERCRQQGIAYVAAPVLGRPEVALRGELNIVAAGDPDTISEIQPVLDVIGRKTWRVGAVPRMANIFKVAVNYHIIHTLQALGESVALIEAQGGSATEFTDLLSGTMFGGVVHQVYGRLIAEHQYWPAGFTLDLGRKDLRLAASSAAEVGLELPSADVLGAMFEKALSDASLEGADWSAIAEITRRQSRG